MKVIILIGISVLSLTQVFGQIATTKYSRTQRQANDLVSRVISESPVIDGHNDLFIHYFDCKDCPRGLNEYRLDTINTGHTDIPRLRTGGVGGLLLNVFGRERTEESYLEAWDLLGQIEKHYNKDLKIVSSSKELKAIMKQKKIALLPSLEGAVRLGDNLELINKYYQRGLRSVTFAYKTNLLADGSDDSVKYHGISSFGKEMVAEMNKLGVLIDLSHISAEAMDDILTVSKAPVIFSHSNVRALCDVNRNVPDSILLKLKQNRGIIMLTFVPYFTTNTFNNWMNAGDEVWFNALKDFPDTRDSVYNRMEKWERANQQPVVTIADMADHFDYAKKLMGVDYIGIAGDYDGIQFTIRGLEDTGTYPNLLVELARRGWTKKELRKVSSENFLRVFDEVEKKARQLQKSESAGN
jgi:membrane dipeptidase